MRVDLVGIEDGAGVLVHGDHERKALGAEVDDVAFNLGRGAGDGVGERLVAVGRGVGDDELGDIEGPFDEAGGIVEGDDVTIPGGIVDDVVLDDGSGADAKGVGLTALESEGVDVGDRKGGLRLPSVIEKVTAPTCPF